MYDKMPSQEEIAALYEQIEQDETERKARLAELRAQSAAAVVTYTEDHSFSGKRAQQVQGPGYIRRRANLRYR